MTTTETDAPPTSCIPDRGSAWRDALDVCRTTLRCLLGTGHVDDLEVTADGRVLRLEEATALAADMRGATTVILDEATGIQPLSVPESLLTPPRLAAPPAPIDVLLTRAFNDLRAHELPVVLIIRNVTTGLSHDDTLADRLRRLAISGEVPRNVQIVALTHDDLPPPCLASATGWHTHQVGLPKRTERRGALSYWAHLGLFDPATLDIESLADTTGGLELDDLRRLIQEHARLRPVTAERLSAARTQALERRLRGLVRVVHHPEETFADVAGGDAVKAVILRSRAKGVFRPIGLFGPPGVGKTMIAKAAARELGVPLIMVDGTLKGGVVGETARNLARFREIVEVFAPACLFWDEFDLLIGHSNDWNGDSGASNEVRQATLTLYEDAQRLGVQIFAASNNPFTRIQLRLRNRMRPIPMIHPTGDDVLQIACASTAEHHAVLDDDAAKMFATTHDVVWNGRDIRQAITTACEIAEAQQPDERHPVVRADDIGRFVKNLRQRRDEAGILDALEALYVTHNPEDLPWQARTRAGRPPSPLPPYLAGLVDADGALDYDAVGARLAASGRHDA